MRETSTRNNKLPPTRLALQSYSLVGVRDAGNGLALHAAFRVGILMEVSIL